MWKGVIRSVLSFAAVFAVASTVSAQSTTSPADHFKGKTIRVVVGTGVGGAYGNYALLFSRHFGKHVPGEPAVVAEHRSGAGGIVAANYLYSVAPKDGTVLGIPLAPMLLAQYTGGDSVKFDSSKFQWIGQIADIARLFAVWHASKVKTFEDLLTHETIAGSSGKGSETFMNPALMNHVFGTKIKIVSGYKGSNELVLALERGEINAVSSTWANFASNHADWLRDGKVRFLVQIATSKMPGWDNVPLLADLAKKQEDRDLIEFMSLVTQSIGYSVMAPPDVPDHITAVLRNAFTALMKDPTFIAEAKQLNVELSPSDYREVEAAVKKATSSPKSLFERFRKVVEEQ